MAHGGVEFHAEQFADFIHRDAAADYQRAASFANHIGRRPAIFFADFADDLLHHVFDSDDSGHQAVLVNHDPHLLILALHFFQQLGPKLRLWHEKSRAHQLANDAMSGFSVRHLEHISRHDDANDVVQRFFKNRQP